MEGKRKHWKTTYWKFPKKHVEVTLDQRVSTATAQFTQSATWKKCVDISDLWTGGEKILYSLLCYLSNCSLLYNLNPFLKKFAWFKVSRIHYKHFLLTLCSWTCSQVSLNHSETEENIKTWCFSGKFCSYETLLSFDDSGQINGRSSDKLKFICSSQSFNMRSVMRHWYQNSSK